MKTKNIWMWIVLASIGYFGCSNMNDLHDEYLQRGETIYTGRPDDSIKIFSGKNRVKIIYRNYDPKATKLTVFWDFRQGSAPFNVPTDRLGEDVELIIDDLQEKYYTFELICTNSVGQYPSIPLSISGQAYGALYTATLSDRKINSATIAPWDNNKMNITWAKTVDNMVGVEVKYKNSSDVETVLRIPNDEMTTSITDAKNDVMEYRTLHLPENCIDTFYTSNTPINFIEVEEPETKLDRLLFTRWNPPGIPYRELAGNPWNIENLWNGIYAGTGYSSPSPVVMPFSFTFDMGQKARISRILIYPRLSGQQYTGNHPKVIEIYGSATSDVNQDFDTWLYLGEFVSIKPSGSAGSTATAEDNAYLEKGEVFKATDNTDVPIRYLRFHITERWSTGNTVQLMEVEVFGFPED